MPIAIITCTEFPIAEQDMAFRDALRASVLRDSPSFVSDSDDPVIDIVPWSTPRVDWARYDISIISTPWDYVIQRERFFGWLETIQEHTRVLNPPDVIRTNAQKRYLLDMEAKGVPIIPTAIVERGDSTTDPMDIASKHAWDDFVIKPEVGAGASGLLRVVAPTAHHSDTAPPETQWSDPVLDSGITTDPARARAHLLKICADTPALIQPYLSNVREGEISLIYFDGAFSHSVRKTPKEGDIRVQHEYGGQYTRHTPSDAERQLGELALKAGDADQLPYCRVDCIHDAQGNPRLIELELFEPQLFTDFDPAAAQRRADAIMAAAERATH